MATAAEGRAESASPSGDQLSSELLEEQFRDVSLRFKANKIKLNERAKQHQHKRDVSEENINREITDLNKALASVTSSDAEVHILCTRLKQHVSVLEQMSRQLASRCEEHGAVQQELRERSAVDIMVQYVDALTKDCETLKKANVITKGQSARAGDKTNRYGPKARLVRRQTVSCISTEHLLNGTPTDEPSCRTRCGPLLRRRSATPNFFVFNGQLEVTEEMQDDRITALPEVTCD